MNKMQVAFLQCFNSIIFSVLQQTKAEKILELLIKNEPQVKLRLLEDTQSASESKLLVLSPHSEKDPAILLWVEISILNLKK